MNFSKKNLWKSDSKPNQAEISTLKILKEMKESRNLLGSFHKVGYWVGDKKKL